MRLTAATSAGRYLCLSQARRQTRRTSLVQPCLKTVVLCRACGSRSCVASGTLMSVKVRMNSLFLRGSGSRLDEREYGTGSRDRLSSTTAGRVSFWVGSDDSADTRKARRASQLGSMLSSASVLSRPTNSASPRRTSPVAIVAAPVSFWPNCSAENVPVSCVKKLAPRGNKTMCEVPPVACRLRTAMTSPQRTACSTTSAIPSGPHSSISLTEIPSGKRLSEASSVGKSWMSARGLNLTRLFSASTMMRSFWARRSSTSSSRCRSTPVFSLRSANVTKGWPGSRCR
mmetsp:Transcript_6378/g.17758  ORF Transcript_6378/g.17758 Transcript_6378/m.17758 type:complete len:286 (-) Transcript_6378:283-1140(-)